MTIKLLLAAATMIAATSAQSAVVISTLPEFNGDSSIGPQDAGTFNFILPLGETIISVVFDGQFGNSQNPTTAAHDLTVDGVLVAQCPIDGACTSDGPNPINYVFGAADFALFLDGSAALVGTQINFGTIRLGESTLTITTRDGVVPEPATWALMITGFGMVGAGMRRRRQAVA